jgi:hypothetical protein
MLRGRDVASAICRVIVHEELEPQPENVTTAANPRNTETNLRIIFEIPPSYAQSQNL